MKKLTVKINDDQAQGLCQMIDDLEISHDMTCAEVSAFTMLKRWNALKLRPRLQFPNGEFRFTMSAPLAFAFLAFLEDVPLQSTDYLGHRLLQLAADIDRTFK